MPRLPDRLGPCVRAEEEPSVMKHDDLVFDVGMHRGEDTQHYLERGFRVVAVEANPALVRAVEERFPDAIAAGRLTIVGAAVAESRGTAEFAVCDEKTIWSSLDSSFVARNAKWGASYRTIEVPAVCFSDLLEEHGIPHYLKIDIEGADMPCVRELRNVNQRPDYLSIESAVTAPRVGAEAAFEELAELWTLGYRLFKFIRQDRHDPRFPPESSGPFGEETPGLWRPIWPTLARALSLRLQYEIGGGTGRWTQTWAGLAFRGLRSGVLNRPLGWYDLHAKLGSVGP
jgi:FkbM family methyltransferase